MPRGKLQTTKDAERDAPAILAQKLAAQGNIIRRVREFKSDQGRVEKRKLGPITAEERADMMLTILEKPTITGDEFGRQFGYQAPDGHVKSSAHEMMASLKDELKGYLVPEMEDLLRADLLILSTGLKEQFRRMREEPDTLNMNEITNALTSSFKRMRLLQGKSTSNTTIRMDDVEAMDEKSIDAYLKDAIRIEVITKDTQKEAEDEFYSAHK